LSVSSPLRVVCTVADADPVKAKVKDEGLESLTSVSTSSGS